MKRRREAGFTLIELMVSIAVLAIIVTIAVPSFRDTINSNRLTGAVNEGAALLQTAKNEAIRRNRAAVVCPVANPDTATGAASCSGTNPRGLIAYIGGGGGVVGRASVPSNVTMQLSGNVGTAIVFRPDGFARGSTGAMLNAVVQYCIPTQSPPENIRKLSVASGSRITTQKSNGSGACGDPGDTL